MDWLVGSVSGIGKGDWGFHSTHLRMINCSLINLHRGDICYLIVVVALYYLVDLEQSILPPFFFRPGSHSSWLNYVRQPQQAKVPLLMIQSKRTFVVC